MKRNKFSLSSTKLLSCDMGELVPIGLVEVLPGDTVQHATSALVRTQPLFAPVMHPVEVRIHHWYVPMRLIWDEFEDFITGGPDGVSLPQVPTGTITIAQGAIGSLADYLGVPPQAADVVTSMLPFRAYNLIYNNWYRDQDLQAEVAIRYQSGTDNITARTLRNICWEKDAYTSARPWEQKGAAITVPLGNQAPVKGIGINDGSVFAATGGTVRQSDGTLFSGGGMINTSSANTLLKGQAAGAAGSGNTLDIYADLTNASAITVTALREAMALQRYEEARARYGSRYVEYLRYLGVKSSDARLQLPEYLGGGSQMISFSEVLQTAAAGSDPVGTMRGHGIGAMRSNRYRRFFEEHGYVLSLLSVRPKTMYVQGLSRLWNRRNKEDFWQRELEHIGQQEMLNKEVYLAHSNPEGVFGYQDRYQEYRRQESTIAGEMRSSLLDFWHLGRTFASNPALNNSFVTCTPTERIFPVPSQDVLYIMARHNMVARRMVSASSKSYIY